MALILQLETSTISCSVTLALNGQTIAIKEVEERNAHASNLTLFIKDVMAEGRKEFSDLDAVAVSMGPGSYTGLRIGVSTAKGLCYALDIPLIAINTLKAMANGYKRLQKDSALLYSPMIDARRMEVYTALYTHELKEIAPVEAKIIEAQSFEDVLKDHRIVFFGDGAMKCVELLKHSNASFYTRFSNSAKDFSELALEKFVKKEFEDVAYFEPYYLKDFLITAPKA
ncbi:MAG: tRNA (adenosine(37)-N6)-threonylcarbamoyltransferase complex dimerization subunit type 1 TsaB [Pyrinomonadaceae bacterium]|nr:tRNA (adenosine(37)-N6)-threonylcarbamoyltransferase complex dimerization subunit type 1 TsaB [Sphingobacteriaceae bacterium]